jgi:hypothetical protein
MVKPGRYCIVFFPQRRVAAPNVTGDGDQPKKKKCWRELWPSPPVVSRENATRCCGGITKTLARCSVGCVEAKLTGAPGQSGKDLEAEQEQRNEQRPRQRREFGFQIPKREIICRSKLSKALRRQGNYDREKLRLRRRGRSGGKLSWFLRVGRIGARGFTRRSLLVFAGLF